MSSAGRAANSNGCVSKPKEHATGLIGFAAQIRRSSLIGSCAMETAEHREPYESRGSRTDLGAPGGETPPGDSTWAAVRHNARMRQHCLSKQTLCRRDCRPLECELPTSRDPPRTTAVKPPAIIERG